MNWLRFNYPPEFVRRLIMWRRLKPTHQAGISDHYDVSNAFYEAMLDKKIMFYTCADFLNSSDTLEEAQENKANAIFDLIDPQPNDEILDLGSGWCAMLRFIEERTGTKDRLHGYTLSQEQVDFNEKEFGFDVEYADFITKDYPRESFDKIYSIGTWSSSPQLGNSSTRASQWSSGFNWKKMNSKGARFESCFNRAE